jgi:hypothetical protein
LPYEEKKHASLKRHISKPLNYTLNIEPFFLMLLQLLAAHLDTWHVIQLFNKTFLPSASSDFSKSLKFIVSFEGVINHKKWWGKLDNLNFPRHLIIVEHTPKISST